MEVFFNEASWYFAVLDRCYFDEEHWRWLRCWHYNPVSLDQWSAETLGFSALLCQFLAIGLQFIPLEAAGLPGVADLACPTFEIPARKLSDVGEDILHLISRRKPGMMTVQADLMRCAWLKNSGNGTDAWQSLGNAIR